MRATLSKLASDGPVELDMLQWMSRTALELVGQGGMGYSFDSLTETPERHGELLRDLVCVILDGFKSCQIAHVHPVPVP